MQEFVTLFFTVFAALFSVANPMGAMPLFLSMTAGDTISDKENTARKASVYFVIILIVSFFTGSYLLDFFGISISAMRIAGGLIILSSGYALMKGEHAKNRAVDKKVQSEAVEKEDISLTPLAMPVLAGPGSISLLIGYANETPDVEHYIVIILAVLAVGSATYALLRFSPMLVSRLGAAGMNSMSRIIGFIVMSVGIQFIINGVTAVFDIK